MDTQRIFLTVVAAARKAGASVLPFFDKDIGVFLVLARQDLERGKRGLITAIEPMIGRAVVRKLEESAGAAELAEKASSFSLDEFFSAGRESGDITEEMLALALPPDSQVLLPPAEVVHWLVSDDSQWWLTGDNAGHLAEVVECLLAHDSGLVGDFVTSIDPEHVFGRMAGEEEMRQRLARFCAGLRAGVRSSAAFDQKLLTDFSAEELVRRTEPDSVWDFCKRGLAALAREAARNGGATTRPGTPPAPAAGKAADSGKSAAPRDTVFCRICAAKNPATASDCASCGEPLAAPATTAG